MRVTHLSAVLAALLVWGPVVAEDKAPPPASTGAKVEAQPLALASASLRKVSREYRLDGVVEAINRTTVSSQTQGQIEEILFDVDDFVAKGTVVARIKDREHRTRVAQAAADLKSASARLLQAEEEHQRIQGLFAKKSVSESAMDQATADLASGKADQEAATARLQQAQEQLEYTQVRAPYAGIVTHRHLEVGEIATPGQPVMTGVSLDELRVIVDVPQSVIPAVRQGAVARVYLGEGAVIDVKDITIFPFADLESNTFKVRVDLPTETRALFPGMFVKTGFVVGEREELVVPKQAVVHRSEVTAVYVVVEGNHVHFRQVRLGRALDDGFVVLSGLSEGEQVALDPIAAGAVLKTQMPGRHAGAGDKHNG